MFLSPIILAGHQQSQGSIASTSPRSMPDRGTHGAGFEVIAPLTVMWLESCALVSLGAILIRRICVMRHDFRVLLAMWPVTWRVAFPQRFLDQHGHRTWTVAHRGLKMSNQLSLQFAA